MAWQPIETAPKDGTDILLFIRRIDSYDICGWHPQRYISQVVGWWDGDEWLSSLMEEGTADTEGYSSATAITIHPTHWMPLPEPPEA